MSDALPEQTGAKRAELSTEEPTPKELAQWPADRALTWLFDRYASQLYHLGLRFCSDPTEAEDLVQEVMLLAFKAWDHFDGRAKPTTWFYTIAARACQRRQRLRAGEPANVQSLDDDSFQDVLPSRAGYVVDLRPVEGDPLEQQIRREASETVESAIAELPLDFRMPLVLKDIVELSVRDIALVTGVPEATVKTRIHRARLRLRKELDRAIPGRPAPTTARAPQVCYDLLTAKLDALDRGLVEVSSEVGAHLCERCEAVFSGLDVAREVCAQIGNATLDPDAVARLQERVAAAIAA